MKGYPLQSNYVGQEAAGQTIAYVRTSIDGHAETIECYAADDTLLQTVTHSHSIQTERPT